MIDLSELKRRIRAATPSRSDHQERMRASVMLLLIDPRRSPAILFTERSESVQHHKKEVSFPGGIQEPGDTSPEATALRELLEETGIPAHAVEVIGRLDDVDTTTGFIVTPIVGITDKHLELRINVLEIDRFFLIPLSYFAQTRPKEEVIDYRGRKVMIEFYPWLDVRIWGATYRILRQFLDIIDNHGRERITPSN